MIREVLLPILAKRFSGQFSTAAPGSEPCVTFPARHPDVGDVLIYDDGDEITLVAGKFTHGHFSNYRDIAIAEKEREIAEEVAEFLEFLFADRVVLWGSHDGGGGWEVIEPGTLPQRGRKEYLWSGPRSA